MVYHSSLSLSDFFSRKRKDEADTADSGADLPSIPPRRFAKFLSSLSTRSQPLLLDLGPVVGTNVTFFGEELGCKILVENLFKDIDRHIADGKVEELPAFFAKRFTQEEGSVDGILCWDIFDYIDKPATQALTKQLVRILRPDGVLLAQFRTTVPPASAPPTYTKLTWSSIARPCSTGLTPPRRQEAAAGQPRHRADVRAAARDRTVPVEEQSA